MRLFYVVGFASLLAVSCGNSKERYSAGKKQPFQVTATQKRLNTVECLDNDDWYLDGYRVGKSFRSHKDKMLQQRTSYCQSMGNQVSKKFRNSWQQGYKKAQEFN